MTEDQRKYIESIEYNLRGLQAASTGLCSGCKTCRGEYGLSVACECGNPDSEIDCDKCDDTGSRPPTMEEFEEQCSSGKVESDGFFSWHGCELCGSSLGGIFEVWHAIDDNNEVVHGERACVDCVMYFANGDLPE